MTRLSCVDFANQKTNRSFYLHTPFNKCPIFDFFVFK